MHGMVYAVQVCLHRIQMTWLCDFCNGNPPFVWNALEKRIEVLLEEKVLLSHEHWNKKNIKANVK